jgi:2'-5' RNA ligase
MTAPQREHPATAASRPVRLFFALWPDAATVRALSAWAAQAHDRCGGRIMQPDSLHLTLAFLGHATPDVARLLVEETRRRSIEPGVVTLSGYGAFAKPRIVWAGPQVRGNDDEGIARLAAESRALWDWAGPLHGSRPEPRFRPHVTLLRNADTGVLPAQAPPPIVWRYDHYVLVASEQNGDSRYRILAASGHNERLSGLQDRPC